MNLIFFFEKKNTNSEIRLSTKVVDCAHRLRLTLAHEMCHAAAWVLDGVAKPPHGDVFRRYAARFPFEITTCHNYKINYPFYWRCTNAKCAQMIGRFSRSISLKKHRCGKCKSTLESVKTGGRARKTTKK